jgi:hypothetical protein
LDPDELLCSETPILNRASLKSQQGKLNIWLILSGNQLQDLIGDLYSFCSSFIESGQKSGIELPSVMVEDEEMFSAFEEITEEQMKRQKEMQLKR